MDQHSDAIQKLFQSNGLQALKVSGFHKGQTDKRLIKTTAGTYLFEASETDRHPYHDCIRQNYNLDNHVLAKVRNKRFLARRFGLTLLFDNGYFMKEGNWAYYARPFMKHTLDEETNPARIRAVLDYILPQLGKLWSQEPGEEFLRIPYASELDAISTDVDWKGRCDEQSCDAVRREFRRYGDIMSLFDTETLIQSSLNFMHITSADPPTQSKVFDWADLKHRHAIDDLVRLEFYAGTKCSPEAYAVTKECLSRFYAGFFHGIPVKEMRRVALLKRCLRYWAGLSDEEAAGCGDFMTFYEAKLDEHSRI